MPATAVVHVRMDEAEKVEAEQTLRSMGLDVSSAVRMFLKRVVIEKAIPFDVRVPNAQTRIAMDEVNDIIRNRRARFATAEELFDDIESGSK